MPMPTYKECIHKLKTLSRERSEWAGLPMLVDGHKLKLEPRFPYQFNSCSSKDVSEEVGDEVINEWFSERLRANVGVAQSNSSGKRYTFARPNNGGSKLIATLFVSVAWLPEAESKANEKLGQMIAPHMMEHYKMTGLFLETSKRSGVSYLFRKLRPTLALRADRDGEMRILCALCLHPIGYYAGTWGGAMCPTDDVLAHLTMMRGDEPKFWANANQHEAHRPEAGL